MNAIDGSNMNGDALVQAHFKGQLWGLAVHPNPTHDPDLEEFVTVGANCPLKVVGVWVGWLGMGFTIVFRLVCL